ncbi:polysaccharide polymerase [Lacticaseibacillus zeae DSM 20178 = KCTC 3804]|uniref:Oligosaccharide repeat unit polymerase n=2 Tax=Lacticaseibacillus zeae TaxID=57037 RepID=A0A5R8LTP2_LACZE|nr:O-antigen polymerase [Lacticaseibacillus zeae]KRK10306.1 polysaccharide polymerase [Lacticaseibacillus zeae DSM 20178 = KCTC 3804]TLF40538.1 oligosaccharide repeat unit polymerase [Lacticaseibacillus zeae]
MLPLAFTLVLILILAYFLNNRELMSPAVLYSGAFAFSGLWALAYAGKWFLEPSSLTVLVLVGGGLEFVFVAWAIHIFFGSLRSRQMANEVNLDYSSSDAQADTKEDKIEPLTVAPWKMAFVIFVIFVGIMYTIYSIKKIGTGMSLRDAIYYVRVQTIFTVNGNTLPRTVSIIRNFSISCGFFFGYLLARERVYFHKWSISNLIIVLLAIVTTLLMGDRTEMIIFLIAIFCYFYFLSRSQKNWSRPNNKKFILGVVAVGVVVLLAFPEIAKLLGRESDAGSNSLDYLSVYIGAEIKNLDSFLRNTTIPVFGSVWGSQTFVNILPWFAKLFNFTLPAEGLNLPFQSVNGVYLGNVYTTYYAYLYDFGIWGVFTLVPVMAGISQVFFERVLATRNPNHVPYSILIYSNIVSALVLSFFSNKFFEQIFARSFILVMIFWVFLNFFIFETGIRQSRTRD